MKLNVFFVILGCAACSTAPTKQRPTPADVVAAKDEVHQLAEQARLNAPWSRYQTQQLDMEEASLKEHIDQLAEAAGIATTVAAVGTR